MRHHPLGIHAFRVLVLGILVLSFTSFALAASFKAKVIHVADGDTITVLTDTRQQIKVRVNGIDCPEKGQAFGSKAKRYTQALVKGERVTIQPYKHDRYGRTIADVLLTDGRNLAHELLKAGYAWWFFKYSDDEHLGQLETKAKRAKVGLWKDRYPMPPWIYRHRTELFIEPNAPSSSPESSVQMADPTPSFLGGVRGNRRSKIYHRPDCPNYHDISVRNRVLFESAQAAEEAGYRLARNCP